MLIDKLLIGLAAVALVAVPAAAGAASIEVLPKPSVYAAPDLAGVAHTVRIAGTIEPGDSDRLRDVLMKLTEGGRRDRGLIVAETSGPGGDYLEGMRIGRTLRDFRVVTVVRKGESCVSTCVLAFLGGSSREYTADGTPAPRRYLEIGATLYFRNYYARRPRDEPGPAYPVQSLIDYSVHMGVDPAFTIGLAALAPDEYAYIDSVRNFLLVRACPIGLPPSTASLEVQAANICNNGSRWFDPEAPHKVRAISAFEARRRVLEAARRNAWRPKDEKERNLGQQLAARHYLSSEAATDRLYGELRSAGISLPEFSGPTFEVSGYRSGLYGLECLVSFAPDDAANYSLLVESPVSGWLVPMVRSVPLQCPGLLAHDSDEIVNPH